LIFGLAYFVPPMRDQHKSLVAAGPGSVLLCHLFVSGGRPAFAVAGFSVLF
jgi:hypothetical protein